MNYNEYWTEIDGFPNYQISTYGQVQNIRTGRYLKPQMTGRDYSIGEGYLGVSLCDGFNCFQKRIHRLVVEAFIGEIPKGWTVNHIDGIKMNNRVENLEIATYTQNNQHALDTGLRKPPQVFKSVRCVETQEEFDSVNDAARSIGAFATEISAVIHGRQRTCRGYSFELVD